MDWRLEWVGERAVVPCGGSGNSTQVGFVLFSIFGAIFVGVIFRLFPSVDLL